MQSTSHSVVAALPRLSSISDIWELGRELTRLAAADIEMTEAQREHCSTEDRDLDTGGEKSVAVGGRRVTHRAVINYQSYTTLDKTKYFEYEKDER